MSKDIVSEVTSQSADAMKSPLDGLWNPMGNINGMHTFKPARMIFIKQLNPKAKVPTYGSEGAACFDFYACLDKDELVVPPHTMVKVGTGLAFGLDFGNVLFMYSRSGHGFKHGLRFVNCVGVIDSDYRGEVMVGLYNDSDIEYVLKDGERIAQGIIQSYIPCNFVLTDDLGETKRGAGGFGSTGK